MEPAKIIQQKPGANRASEDQRQRVENHLDSGSCRVEILIKRVYEPADPEDGFRILVDRVWPRGMTKQQVRADLWLKEVAPSTDLRKWFGHDRAMWRDFRKRYFLELDALPEAVEVILAKGMQGRLTLLYSARDAERNQAVALKEYLKENFADG